MRMAELLDDDVFTCGTVLRVNDRITEYFLFRTRKRKKNAKARNREARSSVI